MSRGPQNFRQRDLTAALRAARQAGCEVARVEVGKDGRIILVFGKEEPADKPGGAVCAGAEWSDLE